MHFSVTAIISALAGGGINHDFTADCTGRRIEMNLATLQVKATMHGMKGCFYGVMHSGLSRNEIKDDFLHLRWGWGRSEHEQEEGANA